MDSTINSSTINCVPNEYKIFTHHKPAQDNIGPIGISYEISPEYPLIRKYERLITHAFLCTCCDTNAYLNLVKQFLGDELVNNNIDYPLLRGNTVLHYATFYNDVPTIEYLLSIGANKDIRNDDGLTPIEVSTSNYRSDSF